MTMKRSLASRYVPASVKWVTLLKGVGRLYRSVYDELSMDAGHPPLTILGEAAYKVGLEFGQSLKEEFGLSEKLDDIELAMRIEHQIFGIESRLTEKTANRLVFCNTSCYWSRYFDPGLCVAIGEAEKGIAQALNPKATYTIVQTRTMGADCCIYRVEVP